MVSSCSTNGHGTESSHTVPRDVIHEAKKSVKSGTDFEFKHEIVWKNVIAFIILHFIALHGLFLILTLKVRLVTIVFEYAYAVFSAVGVTAGTHRYWTHRTYNANLPLRILMMIAQTSALQNDIYEWSRDHRVHHKFTDTDADPHNSQRGFFFCHMGWLMSKKHPAVFAKGQGVDLRDVLADPVVKFQKKYYKVLALLLNQIVPTLIVWSLFGETLWTAFALSVFRCLFVLHGTWFVNSAAHLWGTKPYDKNINPTESGLVISLYIGEGFHNYHHSFPWDYKAAELGDYGHNWTTAFIDFMAKVGWASDLKSASEELVKRRALRTGDGTWKSRIDENLEEELDDSFNSEDNFNSENLIWGWGDEDLKKSDLKCIKINSSNRE